MSEPAVSILQEGLLPLSQTALLVTSDLAYHDFEGVALDLEERARIQHDVGACHYLILRNHGTLTLGRSIPEAFVRMFTLEQACRIQVQALSMHRALHLVPPDVVAQVAGVAHGTGDYGDLAWPALRRRLDREMPGYDQ